MKARDAAYERFREEFRKYLTSVDTSYREHLQEEFRWQNNFALTVQKLTNMSEEEYTQYAY